MKARWQAALVIALLASTMARGAPKAQVKGDLARLQGKWAALTVLPDGTKFKTILEFQGDRVLTTQGDDPRPSTDYRIVVGEKTKPRTLDLVDGKAINQAPGSLLEKIKPPDLYGIYELNGDTLKVAATLGKKRPASFVKSLEVNITVYNRGEVPREPNVVELPKVSKKAMKIPKLSGDLAALQGTWTTGEGIFHAQGKETMTIRGENVVVVANGPRGVELRLQARIKLDEAASPKAIDLLDVRVGSRKQPNGVGIYELNGDVLTMHKSGRGRARSTVFESGQEGGLATTWSRGTVVVRGRSSPGRPSEAPAPSPSDPDEGQVFRGATVVSFSPRKVVLRTDDGRQVEATLIGGKGFGLDGKAAGRGDALLKPGNVIDVTIVPIPTSKIGLQQIKEFHLVRAEGGSSSP